MQHGRAQDYRASDVFSASPVKLVAMLFDKSIRDLNDAAEHLRAGRPIPAIDRVCHSQRILTELGQAVDSDAAPDLADDLRNLYRYLDHKHLSVLVDRDVRHLEDCLRVLAPLRDAWHRLAETTVDTGPAPSREETRGLICVSA